MTMSSPPTVSAPPAAGDFTPPAAGALQVVRSVAALRAQIRDWRVQGLTVGLVPTMGALHHGHLALVRHALTLADRVCVTLFVNPTQFGPSEDFSRYPRQEAADSAAVASAGGQLLYAPTVDEMYAPGFATTVTVAGISEGLCGEVRPGHFSGVATVVAKLLLQALPDVAVFGEKDYQQLQVIRRMVRDLDIPVDVRGHATVREADGLALSSRNAYLTPAQRRVAPALYRVLTEMAAALAAGAEIAWQERMGAEALLALGFDSVDYLEVRDADTLAPAESSQRPGRILVAARLGATRLIDNVAVF